MKDCPINFKECEGYCNEAQVYPAMKYYVSELGMPVRKAARYVRKLTKGKVTDSRARGVYYDRVGGRSQPPKTPATKEIEENQGVATEPDSVGEGCVDYDDVKDDKPNKSDKPKIRKEGILAESFKDSYKNFYKEVQNAKLEKWENTSKEAALKYCDNIINLILV